MRKQKIWLDPTLALAKEHLPDPSAPLINERENQALIGDQSAVPAALFAAALINHTRILARDPH